MNKEQGTFLASLALLLFGVWTALSGWAETKVFQPPAAPPSGKTSTVRSFEMPQFSAEDDSTLYREKGRDPFSRLTEVEPLPLAVLPPPPMPSMTRVAPGPSPGMGRSNLRSLEEAVPEGAVAFTPPESSEEDEGEDEEEDEWERRRW